MPEAPELAHSRDRLKNLLEGQALTDLSVGLAGRYLKAPPQGFSEFLATMKLAGGPRVKEVATHGKFMWWKFNFPHQTENWYLHCTYGMSGGWFTSPSKHTAFIVEYNSSGVAVTRDTKKVFFNDSRHFGTLKFIKGDADHVKKLRTLGTCVFDPNLTPELFTKRMLRKPNRTIAEALMDQSGVAGIGNYIKAEVLFRAGVSPWRSVTDVTPEEYVALHEATAHVVQGSYESQGATIKTYKTADGSSGKGQFTFKIYSKKLCPTGHQTRNEETPEGRTSWWCDICQK